MLRRWRIISAVTLLAWLNACARGEQSADRADSIIDNEPDGGTLNPPATSGEPLTTDADAGGMPAPATPAPCVEGNARSLDEATGHCYLLFTSALPWATAETACQSLGARSHLAAIGDAAEYDRLAALVGDRDVWLGGSDTATEGTFTWLTGEAFTYTRWRSGEPNNDNGNEDCVNLAGDRGGGWDDRPCDRGYAYLCERAP